MTRVGHGRTSVSIQLEVFPPCHSWNYLLDWIADKINNLCSKCKEEKRGGQRVGKVRGHPHSTVSGFESMREKSCHLGKRQLRDEQKLVSCTAGEICQDCLRLSQESPRLGQSESQAWKKH